MISRGENSKGRPAGGRSALVQVMNLKFDKSVAIIKFRLRSGAVSHAQSAFAPVAYSGILLSAFLDNGVAGHGIESIVGNLNRVSRTRGLTLKLEDLHLFLS